MDRGGLSVAFASAGHIARLCLVEADLGMSKRDSVVDSLVLRIGRRQITADREGPTVILQRAREVAGLAQAVAKRTVAEGKIQTSPRVQRVGLRTLPIEKDSLPIQLRRRRKISELFQECADPLPGQCHVPLTLRAAGFLAQQLFEDRQIFSM